MLTAVGKWATARYVEGIANADVAIDLLKKAGKKWYSNFSYFHKGCCHHALGEIKAAVQSSMISMRHSIPITDTRVMCSSWLLTRIFNGEIDFGRIKSCYPVSPDDADVLSTAHGRFAESLYLMNANATESAIEILLKERKTIKKNGCVHAHTVLVWSLLSRAYRQLANEKKGSSKEFNSAAKKALSNSTWATRLTRFMPAPYPEALREHALNLQLIGRQKKAFQYAKKSATIAKKQGAVLEFARSNLLQMQIGSQLGLAANSDVDQAIDLLSPYEEQIEIAKAVCQEFMDSLHHDADP